MRIQGAARAQIEIGQMVAKTGNNAADRARKKEIGKRIESAEEQLAVAKAEQKSGWVDLALQVGSSVLSAIASVATAGVTSFVKTVEVVVKVIQAIMSIAGQLTKMVINATKADNEFDGKIAQVEAEKAKEIADRNQQRARNAQQDARQFGQELGEQVKEMRSAVRV